MNALRSLIQRQLQTLADATDSGFLPNPVLSDDGSVYAQVSTTYSRISRGEREDYVEVFDPVTFNPVADITLPVEAHRFLVGTYPWMSALTPDNTVSMK